MFDFIILNSTGLPMVLTVITLFDKSVIQCSILIFNYNLKLMLKIIFNMMVLTTSNLSAKLKGFGQIREKTPNLTQALEKWSVRH